MALKGKLVRVDGDRITFGSRKKPEWSPMVLTPDIDPSQLRIGSYYEMETSGNRLTWIKQLEESSGPPASTPSHTPYSNAPSRSSDSVSAVVPVQSLIASATGFAKSCLESGVSKTPKDAAEAGLSWARLWDKGQTPDWPPVKPVEPEPALDRPTADPPQGHEFDDEIPF